MKRVRHVFFFFFCSLFQVNSVCWASVTHSDSHVLYPFCSSVFVSGSRAAVPRGVDQGRFPDQPPQVVLGGNISDSRLRQFTARVSLQ